MKSNYPDCIPTEEKIFKTILETAFKREPVYDFWKIHEESAIMWDELNFPRLSGSRYEPTVEIPFFWLRMLKAAVPDACPEYLKFIDFSLEPLLLPDNGRDPLGNPFEKFLMRSRALRSRLWEEKQPVLFKELHLGADFASPPKDLTVMNRHLTVALPPAHWVSTRSSSYAERIGQVDKGTGDPRSSPFIPENEQTQKIFCNAADAPEGNVATLLERASEHGGGGDSSRFAEVWQIKHGTAGDELNDGEQTEEIEKAVDRDDWLFLLTTRNVTLQRNSGKRVAYVGRHRAEEYFGPLGAHAWWFMRQKRNAPQSDSTS
mmetsp:Transcript_50595/g.99538  ORF Transcript_50595/g.99538 Transcript_50595/m.99538 type:complete len:318 (+) Transcript_50595:474-1427(+)